MTTLTKTNAQREERKAKRLAAVAAAEKLDKQPTATPKPTSKGTTTAAKPAASKKTTAKSKPAETTAAAAPKKETKSIATFAYFLEASQAQAISLTPNNAAVAVATLEYFTAINKELHNVKLSEKEAKLLASASDNPRHNAHLLAVESYIKRDTMRLLITERDASKKLVAQFLLKAVYISPFSILHVVEAQNATKGTQSMYSDMIAFDSKLAAYDVFQFNPLLPNLTTSDVTNPHKHVVDFQFVNIVHSTRA